MKALGVEYGGRYVLEGPPQYSSAEQIANPTYAKDILNWSFSAPSWTTSGAAREALPFAGSDGAYVAKLFGKKDATATLRTITWSCLTPIGDVIPGQKYSASLKTNIVDNMQGGVRLYLLWYNAAGAEIKLEGLTSLVTATGVFEFVLNGITAPAGAVRAQFVFQGTSITANDTFDIRLDEASFREVGPRAVFNDSTDVDYVGMLGAESSGLDSPDIREESTDKVEDDGGVHGPFYAGRRPVVLQGTIIASSATDRNNKVDKLRRASLALRRDGTLSWTQADGTNAYLTARRQQPLRVTKGYVKEFQLPLVAADPRIYGPTRAAPSTWTPLAQSQTTKLPGTTANNASVGTVAWTNPNNASAGGSTFATAALNTSVKSNYLLTSNHGFAIPTTSPILGVVVQAVGKRSSSGEGEILDDSCRLVVAGAPAGQDKATSLKVLNKVETEWEFGLGTSLWELALTPAIINASGFGVALSVKHSNTGSAITAEIDFIQITVFYLVGNTVTSQTVTMDGSVPSAPVINIYYSNVTVAGGVELTNATTGQTLKINKENVSNDKLTIDFKNKTVFRNDVTDEYANVEFDPNAWWELQPGENSLLLPPAMNIQIDHADAWM